MSRWAKVGLVCGGYLLALVAGSVAGYLYDVRASAQPYDTSGGMYAAGQAFAALGAFLAIALPTSLLALWFLRGNLKLWKAVAFGALGFASAGLLAVLMPLVSHGTPRDLLTLMIGLLGLAQLLGMPLWTVAFAGLAFLAPTRPTRRLLVAAVGMELVIGVCAAIHWFVPSSPL